MRGTAYRWYDEFSNVTTSYENVNPLYFVMQERVRFGVNIDLTTFKDGKRETHNPAGRAYPSIVWDHYQVR